jgi:hypothetical protein
VESIATCASMGSGKLRFVTSMVALGTSPTLPSSGTGSRHRRRPPAPTEAGAPPRCGEDAGSPGRRRYGALSTASGTNCYGALLAVPLSES